MLIFKQESLNKINTIIEHYPRKHGAIMPVLDLVQVEFGCISPDVIELVAKTLGVEPIAVYEVSTFYTMYNKKPVGKYHIQLCRNISCSLRNAEDLIKHLETSLKVEVGETSQDQKFTLSTVECLGACSGAPCMQINDKYYENMNAEKINELLNKL